jgi:hypothetical protein
MKQSDVRWESGGTQKTGVLISDTMMFQRAEPNPSDTNLGSFYGLAMPLVKHGVPVEPVQIESATAPGFLNPYKLLLLTYEGQKPPKPEFHDALTKWVRAGGALVVVDDDSDAYNAVREWWNTAPFSYRTPREHLFEKLGIRKDSSGPQKVGHGVVLWARISPAALAYKEDGAETVRAAVRQAAAAVKLSWTEASSLILRRGPYIVAAGLDESIPDAKPPVLRGRYLNLFDPELPVLDTVTITPNSRMLLLNLNTPKTSEPKIMAAACRIREERVESAVLRFQAEGISDTNTIVQVASRRPPTEVLVNGRPLETSKYDFSQGMLRLRFANSVEPVKVEVHFTK